MKLTRTRSWLWVVASLAVGWVCLPAHAAPIDPGFDLLSTRSGKLQIQIQNNPAVDIMLIGSALRSNKLTGNPKLGNTDTIIQRLGGLTGSDQTGEIEAQIVSMSLKSNAPIQVDADKFKAFVRLDPSQQALGRLNVTTHSGQGGTYEYSFPQVFLLLDLVPLNGNVSGPVVTADPITVPFTTALSSSSTAFTHEAPPGYPTSPDLPSGGFFSGPFDLTDTLLQLSLVPAQIPEPVTLALVGSGLLLLGLGRWRRVSSA